MRVRKGVPKSSLYVVPVVNLLITRNHVNCTSIFSSTMMMAQIDIPSATRRNNKPPPQLNAPPFKTQPRCVQKYIPSIHRSSDFFPGSLLLLSLTKHFRPSV